MKQNPPSYIPTVPPEAPGPCRSPGSALARIASLLLAAAILWPAGGSEAQAQEPPRLNFDAFGTFGGVYSTEDRADYVWSGFQPSGPGHSTTVSWRMDSRLGLQASLQATSWLNAVVQVVTEQTTNDDFLPRLEWANVRVELTPELSVRAGRVVLPAFLVSDHRKVSFGHPWVRPPTELYGLVPIFHLDGAEATYRRPVGDWTGTLNFTGGRTDMPLSGGEAVEDGDMEIRRAGNLNGTLQRGSLTVRLGLGGARVSVPQFDEFFDLFEAFGPGGKTLAERYRVRDDQIRFAAVGGQYEPGTWFAVAELGWLRSRSIVGERMAGYVSAGRQLGTVTPYAIYSRSALLSRDSADGLNAEHLPPEEAEFAMALNHGLNEFLQAAPIQQSLALGARWDFRPGMALNGQADFVDVLGRSPGHFTNLQPGFETGGTALVLSLATTFVF